MTAPTLPFGPGGWTTPDVVLSRTGTRARTRVGDPVTSHLAAKRVEPGSSDLVNAIRLVCVGAAPLTQFEIAQTVMLHHPRRWSEASIRTACKRAGLIAVDTEGRSPRGSRCLRFVLGVMR